MIGTELSYTNPTDLVVQQSAPFEIIISPGDVRNVSEINSYKLYLTAITDESQPSSEITTIFNQSNPSSEYNVSVVSREESQVLNQDEFAIDATLNENAFGNMSTSYSVESFEFKIGPNSTICPNNNCEFGLEDGRLWSFSAGEYSLSGVMKISAQEEDGKRSKLMNIFSPLDIGEILENKEVKTESLGGKFNLGSSTSVVSSPEISYSITNGSLTTNGEEVILSLLRKENQ